MSTRINSNIYRSRLKNMVEAIKNLHPLVRRIPAPLPKPGSEAYPPSKDITAKEITARQEAYQKKDNFRLDRSVAPYWLEVMTVDETRRSKA